MLHGNIPTDAPRPMTGETPETVPDRRRGSERYVTMLKVGRIVVDGRDQLCLIRNMSREGAKLELSGRVAVDQKIELELRSDRVATGTVRWVGTKEAGVQFDEPVNVQDMLQNPPTRSILRKLPRGPRFLAEGHILLDQDNGTTLSGQLTNISLHGLCAKGPASLKVDERLVVRLTGLAPRRAIVRWASDGIIGLSFENSLGFTELSQWLQDYRVLPSSQ